MLAANLFFVKSVLDFYYHLYIVSLGSRSTYLAADFHHDCISTIACPCPWTPNLESAHTSYPPA